MGFYTVSIKEGLVQITGSVSSTVTADDTYSLVLMMCHREERSSKAGKRGASKKAVKRGALTRAKRLQGREQQTCLSLSMMSFLNILFFSNINLVKSCLLTVRQIIIIIHF